MDCAQNAQSSSEDSDNDVVTDFLNSNCTNNNPQQQPQQTNGDSIAAPAAAGVAAAARTAAVESQNYCIPVINAPPPPATSHNANNNNHHQHHNNTFQSSSNNNNSNHHHHHNNNTNNHQNNNQNLSDMIPIINVTPHSPAAANKYQNIFEDTLSQLQNIRESVVQMKNSSVHMHDGGGGGGGSLSSYGLLNAAILSSSLPDLNAANCGVGGGGGALVMGGVGAAAVGGFAMWSAQQQQQYLLNTDRRKSWTAIDDLSAGGGDGTNKSVSLSSLDSEEQETIRVAEQRRRSARNSAGGISTHSLNEAELARDFERIAAKRSLATEIISRIPLQKSISTSSIVAKEDIKAIKAIARHLTDSEDENQSLLRAHTKIEVYDNVEKRRKRGSLFFRKKKDKAKMKSVGGQINVCDVCGQPVSLANVKDHHLECQKGGSKKFAANAKNPAAGSKRDGGGQDYYDGSEGGGGGPGGYNEDTPLIRSEFLNDPPIEAQDLGAEPILGITLEEHDSWSPSVPKEVLKSLKEKQIKRQEHIYEFIMTEKSHCQTLLVMQKVFVESLERHFPSLSTAKMFPRLSELTELHIGFLKKLRQKQREQYVVDTIADILLDFFSLEKAQHLRLAYGEFCANHRSALEQFKACMTSRDQTFSEWYKHCLANPLLKKKGIPECILFVTQRLTKYPLLIEPLLKSGREDKLESDKLQHALILVKSLLVDVDACVAEKELRERQIEIFNRVDAKSFTIYKNKPFRKGDVGVESRRRLKFEGLATLMQGRSKMQLVQVVVLTDCLCFLSENSAHKYTFFTPEHKAGVVPLQKLLIREKAGTESRGIYIISSNPSFPEMYELKVQQPKDKNIWIQTIRQAVIDCPSTDVIEAEDLTAEEKLRIGVNKRELIEKMRQKDIEQALLLEEKLLLQMNLMKDQKNFTPESAAAAANGSQQLVSAANFLAAFGSYKDLVNVDCDTSELWKRVLNTVQDISQLAATVYTAATGLPVSRSVSSVGEKQSDTYASPTLPKRAETFAGFDEKRAKNVFPCRDPSKLPSTMQQVMTPRLQELEEKRELKVASDPQLLQQQQQHITVTVDGEPLTLKDHNYAAVQVTHHLHTLLCIISQQMTSIHSLQLQLALYRESPRASYTHNDQLEELRNLQDKLQEEKTAWLKQKEQQEQELEETRSQQAKLQEQIKAEQEDIKQQREQLFRKMELLSNQGLLLSPNTPLMISSPSPAVAAALAEDSHDSHHHHHDDAAGGTPVTQTSTVDRRKDKWRTASTISKTPPVNLLSATNAPKASQATVKQKIPMKLSSLSSTSTGGALGASSKIDKSASFNASGGVTQLFPLKLADRKPAATTPTSQHSTAPLVPHHSRTGSSPAVIQQATATTTAGSSSVSRTDSSATYTYGQRHYNTTPTSTKSHSLASAASGKAAASSSGSRNIAPANNGKPAEEEEIYF